MSASDEGRLWLTYIARMSHRCCRRCRSGSCCGGCRGSGRSVVFVVVVDVVVVD